MDAYRRTGLSPLKICLLECRFYDKAKIRQEFTIDKYHDLMDTFLISLACVDKLVRPCPGCIPFDRVGLMIMSDKLYHGCDQKF